MASNAGDYKLELSILWGVYSLVFVSLGIWLKKQHYRVAAIALFGFTLLKLFFYDISHLSTISKTIELAPAWGITEEVYIFRWGHIIFVVTHLFPYVLFRTSFSSVLLAA